MYNRDLWGTNEFNYKLTLDQVVHVPYFYLLGSVSDEAHHQLIIMVMKYSPSGFSYITNAQMD